MGLGSLHQEGNISYQNIFHMFGVYSKATRTKKGFEYKAFYFEAKFASIFMVSLTFEYSGLHISHEASYQYLYACRTKYRVEQDGYYAKQYYNCSKAE